MFEVPTHHKIHIRDCRHSDVSRIVARCPPNNLGGEICISEFIGFQRRTNDLHVFRG